VFRRQLVAIFKSWRQHVVQGCETKREKALQQACPAVPKYIPRGRGGLRGSPNAGARGCVLLPASNPWRTRGASGWVCQLTEGWLMTTLVDVLGVVSHGVFVVCSDELKQRCADTGGAVPHVAWARWKADGGDEAR